MSFADKESSRTQSLPAELYLFVDGDDRYAYTDAEDDIAFTDPQFGPLVYKAVPISRNNIGASGALDRATLTIRIAEDTLLAARLRGYPRSSVISVRLRQGHLTDPDEQFLVAWAGRVLSSKGLRSERAISCQPISTSLRRNGLRRNWQRGCPHALYGDRCRASQAAATTSALVVANYKNNLVVNDGWNVRDMGKYQGGLVTWNGEVRTIQKVVPNGNGTDTLILGGPLPGLTAGQRIDVALGCDHQSDDCQNLHVPADESSYGGGNIHNYGGQLFIPTTTPIGFVSNFG